MRLMMTLLAILTFSFTAGLTGCGKKGDLAAPPGFNEPGAAPEDEQSLMLELSEEVTRV